MDHYDVKRLALVLALQAEIEGMKADNSYRERRGESQAYDGEDFSTKSDELETLAHAHNEQL